MSNPFYRYDPDQCILCGRCVEACQNLQVSEVLSIDWERERPRVIWDNDVPINESSCVSCGHCVTVCPCNALMEKSMLGEAGYLTGVESGTLSKMIDVTNRSSPVTPRSSPSRKWKRNCAKRASRRQKRSARTAGLGAASTSGRRTAKSSRWIPRWTHRPTRSPPASKASSAGISSTATSAYVEPLIRRGDAFYPATWDEALDLIAKRFQEIRAEYGDDALAFISSSKMTNEENYLMQKLARAVMHTNNIDNCSRYCQSPATGGAAPDHGLRRRHRRHRTPRAGGPRHHRRRQPGGGPPGAFHAHSPGTKEARTEVDCGGRAEEHHGRARRLVPALPAGDGPRVALGCYQIHHRPRPPQRRIPAREGQQRGGVHRVDSEVHTRVHLRSHRLAKRTTHQSGRDDHGREGGVRLLGDGRDAAHWADRTRVQRFATCFW